jgi:hypothetical protein
MSRHTALSASVSTLSSLCEYVRLLGECNGWRVMVWKVGLRSLLSWTLFQPRYEVLPSFTRTALVQVQECSDKSNKSIFNSDIVDSRSYTFFAVDIAVGTVTTDDREIRVIFPPVTQSFPSSKASKQPLGPSQVFLRPVHETDHASPFSCLQSPYVVMK